MEDAATTKGTLARLKVLGRVHVVADGTQDHETNTPSSARQLLAILAAAGPDGIDRDEAATELWGSDPPSSWKSALRNRVTAARKVAGPDAILSSSKRLRLADHIEVDSWGFLADVSCAEPSADEDLAFLRGEPFADVPASPRIRVHALQIEHARLAAIQHYVRTNTSPSPTALASLRDYHQQRASDPAVTAATIHAHRLAGMHDYDEAILAVARHACDVSDGEPDWLSQLASEPATPQPTAGTTSDPHDQGEAASREHLFLEAAHDDDWHLALEIAMTGLPMAERVFGDPERLRLLLAIPPEKLDQTREFLLSITVARHLSWAGNDDEAVQWSKRARTLASTPAESAKAFVTGAVVGDTLDERTPLPLPASFASAPNHAVNIHALQISLMSHWERSACADVEPLRERFTELVDESGDAYRRWHIMKLDSMQMLLQGEPKAAKAAARRAAEFAALVGIADGPSALMTQLTNAHWVHRGFSGIANIRLDFPDQHGQIVWRSLDAFYQGATDEGHAATALLANYNYDGRGLFAFPQLVLLASVVTDPDERQRIARRLKARSGTSAIWGTGSMHLGPVDRALAFVVDDAADRDMHLATAVLVADRQCTPLWQVVSRLDLAAAVGNQELVRQAESYATTGALRELLLHYRSPVLDRWR